jgi:hypothetical protein
MIAINAVSCSNQIEEIRNRNLYVRNAICRAH